MHGIQDRMGRQWDYPPWFAAVSWAIFLKPYSPQEKGEPRSYLEFAKHMIASVLFCEPHPNFMVEKMILPTIWWLFWVFPYFQTIAKMKVPFSLLASCWTFWLILILTPKDFRSFVFRETLIGPWNMGLWKLEHGLIAFLSINYSGFVGPRNDGDFKLHKWDTRVWRWTKLNVKNMVGLPIVR